MFAPMIEIRIAHLAQPAIGSHFQISPEMKSKRIHIKRLSVQLKGFTSLQLVVLLWFSSYNFSFCTNLRMKTVLLFERKEL
jgi:hypothetical protein